MRAVVAERPGGVDVLALREVEDPVAGRGQVVVAVEAVGVCGHDVLNRRGAFPRTSFPAILGHEVAGVVAHVGPDVTDLVAGDLVVTTQNQPCDRCDQCVAGEGTRCRQSGGYLGESSPGGYAELVAVDATAVERRPAGIDGVTGSVLACAVGTGLRALRRGRLRPDETVVVTGAGGGVGLHAVQLAAHFGARTVAVTSSPAKRSALRAAGADEVVVTAGDVPGTVKRLTSGGADLVVETVGARAFDASVRSLRPGGRVVLVGNVDGRDIRLQPGLAILKELEVIASAGCTRPELREVLALVEAGAVRPEISSVLPLSAAAEAHGLVERRAATGRVVLRCR